MGGGLHTQTGRRYITNELENQVYIYRSCNYIRQVLVKEARVSGNKKQDVCLLKRMST